MKLTAYREKRRFDKTQEPRGTTKRTPGHLYVIQKHAARRLHYDFRLELNGVLKSWAIPKGPSLRPGEKRLAVHVEDHPVEYGHFEGQIPEGEYGGGTVIIWDHGLWKPTGSAERGYQAGKLKFRLYGERLRGAWTLVRIQAHATSGKEQWLLRKEPDAEAQAHSPEIVARATTSVISGKTLTQLATEPDTAVWDPSASIPSTGSKSKPKTQDPMPDRCEPQLASLRAQPPTDAGWLHEIKFDGYRCMSRIEHGQATLFSRNQLAWTHKFQRLAEQLESLPVRSAWFDGEVVVLGPDGRSDFGALQRALNRGHQKDLVYYVFDLLYFDGQDLRSLPLQERKHLLSTIVPPGTVGTVRYSEHVRGDNAAYFNAACRAHLEGMILKRADRPYRSGRSADWVKVKCRQQQEFIVGGFTGGQGSREAIGALLLGLRDEHGRLYYAGRAGTGFDQEGLRRLLAQLQPLTIKTSPFVDPKRVGPARTINWVQPRLIAEIAFANWTRGRLLRQAVFLGLREDKHPAEVVLESASAPGPKPRGEVRKTGLSARNRSRHDVKITHADRVLYPELGITKRELARYYEVVAEWLLPHIVDRPLSLVRCPDGVDGSCFVQKHLQAQKPTPSPGLTMFDVGKSERYITVRSVTGLLELAQMSILELHPWGARIDKIEQPDRITFDLDPDPKVPWREVVETARLLHELLTELGLQSFVKTTGGKGLHIVLPIRRGPDWDTVKTFSKRIAELFVQADPAHYVSTMSKSKRNGRIFIDYLRNGRGATAVAAYSPRSRPSAPISLPIDWNELTPKLRSDELNLVNAATYLRSLYSDPWAGLWTTRQGLTRAIQRRVGMP